MASKKTSGVTAMRYATALIDTAESHKKIDDVAQDIQDIEAMLNDSEDFRSFVKSPLISIEEKSKTVEAIAAKAKLQDITTNFLKLLAENGRLDILNSITGAVAAEISKRRGEVVADVQSAFPIDAKQTQALQAALKKAVGKEIAINVEIDKDLIGGMIVTVGSQMFDASVKRKLERLRIAMMSGANNNTDLDKAANQN
ncbi:MAG: F0F1 ATP synthase subunit delta [Pseudomonadota bacterium]